MDHQQIYAAVHDPAGDPGTSMGAEEAWRRVADVLDAGHARIRAAVGASAKDWIGGAATLVRAAFDPLHAWADITVQDAATVSAQLTDQGFHAAELRRKVPPPMSDEAVRALVNLAPGSMGGLTVSDADVASVASRIHRESSDYHRSVDLMRAYQHDSDRRAGTIDIRTQPPQVVVGEPGSAPTSTAAAPGGSGYAGGSPAGVTSTPGPGFGPGPVGVPPAGAAPPATNRPDAPQARPGPPGPATPGAPGPGGGAVPHPGRQARTAPGPTTTPGRPGGPVPARPAPATPRPVPRLDPGRLPPGFGGRSPGVGSVPLGRVPGVGRLPDAPVPTPKDWRELVRADGPRGAAAEPVAGSARPAGEPRHSSAMYPPMMGAGAGSGGNTRRRPGYLLGDGSYYRDDRWFPPAVITPDDPLPVRDDPQTH